MSKFAIKGYPLIFLYSLIQTITLTPPPNNALLAKMEMWGRMIHKESLSLVWTVRTVVLMYVPYTSLGRGMLLLITVEPECLTWSGSWLGSANLIITQWSNCLYLTIHTKRSFQCCQTVQRGQPGCICTWDITTCIGLLKAVCVLFEWWRPLSVKWQI